MRRGTAMSGVAVKRKVNLHNLNKGKACPECGKLHGNKTGGREGGTLCGGEKQLVFPDGTTTTVKCTYLFTSESSIKRQKLLSGADSLQVDPAAVVKLSKARKTFDKLKEKVRDPPRGPVMLDASMGLPAALFWPTAGSSLWRDSSENLHPR